jgi:hypothetical protein
MDQQALHQPVQLEQPADAPLVHLSLTTDSSPAALIPAATGAKNPKYLEHSYTRQLDAFTDWIIRRLDELVALDQGLPLVVPLTVTFALNSIRPGRVLSEFERFYARLCRLLLNNYERPSKRHLLPFALAFRDDPSTRPEKHRDRPSAFAVFSNHPSIAPHVHSLLVVHPTLVDRFLGIVGTLEATWRRIPVRPTGLASAFDAPRYANRTLHADVPFALEIRQLLRSNAIGAGPLVRAAIRRVVAYSAKLGCRHDVGDGGDLFTVLPPTRAEPRINDVRFGSVS